jgi:hypothetical protein
VIVYIFVDIRILAFLPLHVAALGQNGAAWWQLKGYEPDVLSDELKRSENPKRSTVEIGL